MKIDKKLSVSGGLRLLTPHQGLCPWTPLQTPRPFTLALRVLAMVPPLEKSWIRHCLQT